MKFNHSALKDIKLSAPFVARRILTNHEVTIPVNALWGNRGRGFMRLWLRTC